MPQGLKFFTMAQLCRLLQISRPTVYRYMEAGRLHPAKLDRELRFAAQDVREFLIASGLPGRFLDALEDGEDSPSGSGAEE